MSICFFIILNKSTDWKKNEYLLKVFFLSFCFFWSSDPALRKEIDVISHPDHITQQDTGKDIDIVKIPVYTKLMG